MNLFPVGSVKLIRDQKGKPLCSNTALKHLGEIFVNWNAAKDEYMPGSDLKWDFKMFASFVAMALNWRLDNSFGCWQFNFQHYFFPAHTDGCGFLQPKLNGGEGFGEQIAVVQLRGTGETWVYIVAPIPTCTSQFIGIKFLVRTGDVWSMEDCARYQYMHALSAPFPVGVHKPTCLDCKVTATLRNGLGQF